MLSFIYFSQIIIFPSFIQIQMDPTMSCSCHLTRISFAPWKDRKDCPIPASTWDCAFLITTISLRRQNTLINWKMNYTMTFKSRFPPHSLGSENSNDYWFFLMLSVSYVYVQLTHKQPACDGHFGAVQSGVEVLLLWPQHRHLQRERQERDAADTPEEADGTGERAHRL